jgi:2-oxo-3-hexenedioate decarboxylase
MSAQANTIVAIAAEAAAALGRRQIAPFSARHPQFGIDDAYAAAAELRRMREATGEVPAGRKIGFTNRTIWQQYGVSTPMWGDMYDTTIHDVSAGSAFSLGTLPEPRIEPEIVFGLSRAPAPDTDERGLLDCIEWVAHGFEIVQSIFPDWKFTISDTIVASGLHGALLIGPRHRIADGSAAQWFEALGNFEIGLQCNGAQIDRGTAELVLGGPLTALAHLVGLLAHDRHNPPLRAGEIVTTGTVTRAFPIAPGERWSTTLSGIPLEPMSVAFI